VVQIGIVHIGGQVDVLEVGAQFGPAVFSMTRDPFRVPKGSAYRDLTVLVGVVDIGRIAAADCLVRLQLSRCISERGDHLPRSARGCLCEVTPVRSLE